MASKTSRTALHPDEREMKIAFAHFERNPSADHWIRLETIMLEYQDLTVNVHSLATLDVKLDAILLRTRSADL